MSGWGSTYQANRALGGIFGNEALYPSGFAVALLTAMPTGDVSTAVEVSDVGTDYARGFIDNTGDSWNVDDGRAHNIVTVGWNKATADYGTVVGYFLLDLEETNIPGLFDSTCVVWGDRLLVPKTVLTNDIVAFAANSILIPFKVGVN